MYVVGAKNHFFFQMKFGRPHLVIVISPPSPPKKIYIHPWTQCRAGDRRRTSRRVRSTCNAPRPPGQATHTLLDAGVVEIYSFSYEALLERSEKLKEEEQRAARQQQLATGKQWEFCWSREPGAEMYGPYTSEEMHAWKEHKFFSAERVAYARPKEQDMFAMDEAELQEAHTIDFIG